MASALTIQYCTIMLAGGKWLNNMHGSLNCYYSKKGSWSCVIVLYKDLDDIHDQSGIVRTIADVHSFSKDKPGYIWGKRYLYLNRVVRTLQLAKEMSSKKYKRHIKLLMLWRKWGEYDYSSFLIIQVWWLLALTQH